MRFSSFKSWVAGLCVLALVGCGGGGSAGDPILGGGGTSAATVAVALSSVAVTPASPATVTVTVRDGTGGPISGTVVDLSTVRGNLATLNVASAVTDASGQATARLSVGASGISGADELVAVANLGTTTVQGTTSFSVSGGVPTFDMTVSSTTVQASKGSVLLRAVLKDAAGVVQANKVVKFAVAGELVTLSAETALTDASGLATVSLTAASATGIGAETITASSTIGVTSVEGNVLVQVQADKPSIAITPSSSLVSATAPATLNILLRDTNNDPLGAGTIVTLTSSFGLSAFDVTTAATDSTGVARVVVTPRTGTSNGADQIVAAATVGGVPINANVVVQVSSATSAVAPPVLQTTLSSTSISSATPATVTAKLTDGRGSPVPGQVVTFTVVRGLAKTNISTALTDASGLAVVVLSPASSTVAGADEVAAALTFSGTDLRSSKGFQVQATNVSLSSFKSAVPTLSAYGQTTLTLGIDGASVGSPVNISVTSSCVSQGKATLSPSTFTATTASVDLQYKDNGCGAVQGEDKLQAVIVGSTSEPQTLTQPISTPAAASIAFLTASPEVIYIKASGFTETSTLTFEVRDGAGNILPNRRVTLSLLTQSGGVTMEGGTADITQESDAAGRVAVRVNSGTQPTPVRVSAALSNTTPTIATVSSNLSVAVGLPSQLNFSLSQQTINIEGMSIDGTPNTYTIISSDRNGNPVPNGTSINFISEGGQIEPIVRTSGSVIGSPVSATATARFQSSDPRPADGRITITAYALGEESFIDQNGNNIYDASEPFQDLGVVFKDRIFDGIFDGTVDETVPTNIADRLLCQPVSAAAGATPTTNALLALNASTPSVGGSTCDSQWSGAGKVYVRRAIETVLSTSGARALWASTSGLDNSCRKVVLQNGPQPTTTSTFTAVRTGETWHGDGISSSLFLSFIVGDANTFPTPGPNGSVGRLNPMPARTTVSASTPTTGLRVTVGGGGTVPNTSEATFATVGVTFESTNEGIVFVTFTSPGGVATTYAINVKKGPAAATSCP